MYRLITSDMAGYNSAQARRCHPTKYDVMKVENPSNQITYYTNNL